MPDDGNSMDKENELLDGNIKLRIGIIKKKISQYFEDVEDALRKGTLPPTPKDINN